MEDGQLRMENGEWRMENGELRIEDGNYRFCFEVFMMLVSRHNISLISAAIA